MLEIKYQKQKPNNCALACYQMVSSYFFPKIKPDAIEKLTRAESGYIVWAFPFWLWMTKQDIQITEYDVLDYKAWAENGLEGLKQSVPEQEFNFYLKGTKNIDAYSSELKELVKNPNFTLIKRKPTFEDLKCHFQKGDVCEVVLDSRRLNNLDGFSLHRVVVLDITKEHIIFHDPNVNPTEKNIGRKETIEHFKKSWLEVEAPELCCYSQKS